MDVELWREVRFLIAVRGGIRFCAQNRERAGARVLLGNG